MPEGYRGSDPITSALAYLTTTEGQRENQRNKIIQYFVKRQQSGVTPDEFETVHGWGHQRFSELHHKFERIQPTGETRPTKMGKSGRVYILAVPDAESK